MGREFTVEYDDFTGGHFVGNNDTKQPFNTWTGNNICTTADEGFLMADGGWSQSDQIYSSSNPNLVMPLRLTQYPYTTLVTLNGIVYAVDSAGAVSTYQNMGTTPTNMSRACIANISSAPTLVMAKASPSTLLSTTGGGVTTSVTAASTFFGEGVWCWKNWILSFSVRTLYWTDPDAVTTATNNFLNIPTNGTILTLVPTSDALYVATADGWWAVTGVLGESTNVRRVTKFGAFRSFTSSARGGRVAAEVSGGIAHASANGFEVRVLGGTMISPLANLGTPDAEIQMVQGGDCIMVTNALGHMYVWSETRRSWRVSVPPIPATLYRMYPVEDGSATTTDLVALGIHTSAGNYVAHTYSHTKEPTQPTVTSGSFDTATVTLADYVRPKEFRIKELLVEIDKGTTSGASSATRTLAVQVVTYPIVDMAGGGLDDTGSGTSGLTKTFASSDSAAGEREMVRFAINDAGPTFTAKPILGLRGVKVRRVIMRCEEV